MNRYCVLTIELKVHLNWALVEWYTGRLLRDYNLDISAFTREEIARAWTAAIQTHIERYAQDSDYFLDQNGVEEQFWRTLLAE